MSTATLPGNPVACPANPLRVIKLARISKDRDNETSTRSQHSEVDGWITANHATVVASFTEEGRSGFKNIPRPKLDEAIRMVTTGLADGIVVWKLDRFTRKGAIEIFRMIAELTKAGRGFVIAVADGIDTRNDDIASVIKMTVIAEVAKAESVAKAQRAQSWHNDRTKHLMAPNGPLPYGYKRPSANRLEVEPREAEVIKRIAAMVLDGGTLTGIARTLNNEGVLRRGNPWNKRSVKHVVTNETTAGVKNIAGDFVRGSWEPVLDLDTWTEVRAILGDPSRLTTTPEQRKSRHLLTGIVMCGRKGCEGSVRVQKHTIAGYRYVCRHCGISADKQITDDVVTDFVLAKCEGEAWDQLRAQGKTRDHDAMSFLKAKLARNRARWLDDKISDDDYEATQDDINKRIDAIMNAPVLELPNVDKLRPAWEADQLTIAEKRTVIEAVVNEACILPYVSGTTGYDRIRVL